MKKAIVIIAIITLLLGGAAISYSRFASIGDDYTEEYQVYNEVKDIADVNSIKEYLSNNRLEYTIKENVLKIKEYSDIQFNVDGTRCSIVDSSIFESFETLNKADTSEVKVEGVLTDDRIVEKTSFENEGYLSTLQEGKYYYNSLYVLSRIMWVALLMIAGGIISGSIFSFFHNKKGKKESTPFAEPEFNA